MPATKKFDVLVLGLGAAGSSALYQLSKHGLRVAGIDRFSPPHSWGSSHGESRIIRQAYFETPRYVPLVQEAFRMWLDFEEEVGRPLLLKNGSLMLGREDSTVVAGALRSATVHDLSYQYLKQDDIARLYLGIRVPEGTVAVLEHDAGILYPEICIQAFLDRASNNGATFFLKERVLAIYPHTSHVEVRTDRDVYYADRIVVAVGAWLGKLLPALHIPLGVERRVLHWFKDRDQLRRKWLGPNQLPVYIWEYADGKMFYGFPDLGNGLKIANTDVGVYSDPDQLDRNVTMGEKQVMSQLMQHYFHCIPAEHNTSVCMYTMTPDEDFIFDRHPYHSNVIIASPCSGHGFKFASLSGKIICHLALDHALPFDISMFALNRFSRQ